MKADAKAYAKITVKQQDNSRLWLLTAGCLLFACALALTQPVAAQENSEQFVPDSLYFYNPLKEGDNLHSASYQSSAAGMDNQALQDAVGNFRSSTMTTSQRALNHQWLSQYHHDTNVRQGSKVISKILKMGFKTYWNGVRESTFNSNKMVPDGEGNGTVGNDVNYKLRLSDNKVKLSIKYQF